jgi:endonuclease/exonuclease/phosphatase family metal-dependent hydrolase
MSRFFVLLTFFLSIPLLHACDGTTPKTVLNLNVFDQLQGQWEPDFRAKRMAVLAQWVHKQSPDLVVFQEAKGELPGASGGGGDSSDIEALKDIYPYRKYVHEMTGADGASYGYWMGAKSAPRKEWSDGFAFPGGVARKTQAAVWGQDNDCVGVLSLHLSYQNTSVRQLEAKWVLDWIDQHKVDCPNWLVMGDFNADQEDAEIQILTQAGLRSTVVEKKPTVGAFNPIRQIYGKDIPSRTIDWIFAQAGLAGLAEVVFDTPVDGLWISDHAGIFLQIR